MWSLAKKMFSRKKTNESVPACNHDESDKPPSTTRVVLIMCSVALLIFSVGYTLKPVSTIVREVSEPDIIPVSYTHLTLPTTPYV